MQIEAIFRVDVSETIGYGHLRRALAMESALSESNIMASIYCMNHAINKDSFSSYISKTSNNVIQISNDREFEAGIESNKNLWLFIDLIETNKNKEIIKIIRKAKETGAKIICFDEFFCGELEYDLF